ncbi:MAG: carotenoid biosynthesis protein [Actinobacteria bacterium]|nr:carotenoid biosynthesis protein [Actinomycetota bacterium]
MSVRHYSPRRNRHRGISRRMNIMLVTVLSIAIGLQIIYPLVNGEALRLITIAIVYWGAGAMLLHALLAFGGRYATRYLLLTFFFALIVEHIGVLTSWPFGEYSYSPDLGFRVFSVPLVVPFAWIMMAHPVLIAARRVAGHWIFLYGGVALTAWDLFLDPLMVSSGRWSWVVKGAHVPFQPEIPLSNTFGWLLTGMGLIGILHLVLPRDLRKIGASYAAVDVYLGWILFSGVVGNLFFFSRPGIAIFAGTIFGAVLTPYLFTRWLGRP